MSRHIGKKQSLTCQILLLLSAFHDFTKTIQTFLLSLWFKYKIGGNRVNATEVIFGPIEFFDWSCLTIGALGWGQIQIANSNNIIINDKFSRKKMDALIV